MGKHAFFHLSAWTNHWTFLEPLLVYVITLVRPTDTPNLVEIGLQGALPHSGKMSRFCDFCSPIFNLLISPTGRNFRPIRTFNSSNDVFCSVHVPFRGLEPSNSLLRGLRPPKHPNFDPFLDCRFAAEIASALEPSRVNYP